MNVEVPVISIGLRVRHSNDMKMAIHVDKSSILIKMNIWIAKGGQSLFI